MNTSRAKEEAVRGRFYPPPIYREAEDLYVIGTHSVPRDEEVRHPESDYDYRGAKLGNSPDDSRAGRH